MILKRLVLVLAVLFVAAMSFAQSYTPKKGETLLKVAVEGKGALFILLFTDKAPKTTAHIMKLARDGFYDNMRFHKVVRTPRPYLAQLGAPGSKTKNLDDEALQTEGSGSKVAFEDSGISHDAKGIVGLATVKGDKNSGDSQFYMLLAPAKFLDGAYTVFGRVVTESFSVLDRIEKGDKISSVTVVTG